MRCARAKRSACRIVPLFTFTEATSNFSGAGRLPRDLRRMRQSDGQRPGDRGHSERRQQQLFARSEACSHSPP